MHHLRMGLQVMAHPLKVTVSAASVDHVTAMGAIAATVTTVNRKPATSKAVRWMHR